MGNGPPKGASGFPDFAIWQVPVGRQVAFSGPVVFLSLTDPFADVKSLITLRLLMGDGGRAGARKGWSNGASATRR